MEYGFNDCVKALRDTLSLSFCEALKLNSLEEDWCLIGEEIKELLVKKRGVRLRRIALINRFCLSERTLLCF